MNSRTFSSSNSGIFRPALRELGEYSDLTQDFLQNIASVGRRVGSYVFSNTLQIAQRHFLFEIAVHRLQG